MRLTLSLAVALVAGIACGDSTTPPVAGASPSRSVVTATVAPTSAPPTSAATSTAATSPVLRIVLTDVRTGERFTLGGFPGKTVIVEGMAVW
jgi:hypothetical protein